MLLKNFVSALLLLFLLSCTPVAEQSRSAIKHPTKPSLFDLKALQQAEIPATPDSKKAKINFLIEQMFKAPDEATDFFLPEIEKLAHADRHTWWIWDTNKTNKYALLFNYSAYLGNTKLFKQLLKKYPTADANGLEFHSVQPITYATLAHNLEIISLILDTWGKSQLTVSSNPSNWPFSGAAHSGDIPFLQFLIQKGVDKQTDNGYSIVSATTGGHLETIKFILRQWGKNWIPEERKQEAIDASLAKDSLEIFNFLLKELPPKTFSPNIIAAAAGGHLDILQRFIAESGQDSITEETRQNALEKSIANGHLSISYYLLDKLKPAQIPADSIYCAVASGDTSLVKKLLSRDNFNLNAQSETFCFGKYYNENIDIHGKTPLEIAEAYNHVELAAYLKPLDLQKKLENQQQLANEQLRKRKELEKKQADLEAEIDKKLPIIPSDENNMASATKKENTALFQLMNEMASSNRTDMSLYIGRIIGKTNRDTETIQITSMQMHNKDLALLLLAAKYNHVELLKQLLKKYPDYEQIRHKFRLTKPIDLAIKHGNTQIAKLLINSWGKGQLDSFNRPLLEAVKVGSPELVREFLETGAEWNRSYDGDPIVMAMSLGHRGVAKVFMLHQGVTRLTDDQSNEIFQKAIDDYKMDLANTMVDSVTDTDQKALYYAAALGNKKMLDKLSSFPSIDLTTPAQKNYFNGVEIQGETADEIAFVFGHHQLAEQIKGKVEAATIEKQQLETDRLAQKEFDQRQQRAQKKREEILAQETPFLGPLRVKVLQRYLGFKGVKRSEKMNSWKSPSRGVEPLSNLVKADKSYPLRFRNWEKERDLKLYVSQKRGLSKLSPMINEVYLFSAAGEVLRFSFNKRGDTSFEGIAPTLIEKLNKALAANSAAIAQVRADRDQNEIARTTKIKNTREKEHDQTMLAIRNHLKNKGYQKVITLIEQVEEQGIYQSDSLGYIKARILYKLGQSDQAKITLKLYIADHAESESKYVVKAKQLLESI